MNSKKNIEGHFVYVCNLDTNQAYITIQMVSKDNEIDYSFFINITLAL